jgi:hypothetical protein
MLIENKTAEVLNLSMLVVEEDLEDKQLTKIISHIRIGKLILLILKIMDRSIMKKG